MYELYIMHVRTVHHTCTKLVQNFFTFFTFLPFHLLNAARRVPTCKWRCSTLHLHWCPVKKRPERPTSKQPKASPWVNVMLRLRPVGAKVWKSKILQTSACRDAACRVKRSLLRFCRVQLKLMQCFCPFRACFADTIYPGCYPGLFAFGLSGRFFTGHQCIMHYELCIMH